VRVHVQYVVVSSPSAVYKPNSNNNVAQWLFFLPVWPCTLFLLPLPVFYVSSSLMS